MTTAQPAVNLNQSTPMPAEAAHWLGQCQQAMIDQGVMIKVAELGGDGQDVPFEQAFSNLAHAFLRDKAPTLLDHELGFQLLDRNEENTKAVGVMAFKVGSHQLFAPVFFLSGDLKGHELLYISNQDMFVPMKENWLNYILNRRPNILGSGVDKNTSELGVMQPDLTRLSQSPYKYASSVQPFLPKYAHMCVSDFGSAIEDFEAHCHERLDLGHFIKQAGLPMLQVLADTLQRKPVLAAAFDRWHGVGELQAAVKEAGVRMRRSSILDDPYRQPEPRTQPCNGSVMDLLEKEAADGDKGPDAKGKVVIITMDASWVEGVPEGLDEEDAEKLLKEHVLIEDKRTGDEVSVPYNVQVEQKLSNPSETGIYMVLAKPNDFKKCLIVMKPHGPDGRLPHCVIVDLDTKDWTSADRDAVWVAGQLDEGLLGGEESWMEWFDGIPEGSVSMSDKHRYIAVGPRRNATTTFALHKEIGDDSYDVAFSENADKHGYLSTGLDKYHSQSHEIGISYDKYCSWDHGARIHFDAKKGTQLRSNMGDLYIPDGYKILKIKETSSDRWERKHRDDNDDCCAQPCAVGGSDDHSDNEPIQPGSLLDAQNLIMRKTAALEIRHDGTQFHINKSAGQNEVGALVQLVRDHGLREDISRHLLKQAEVECRSLRPGPFRCRIKYADPYLTDSGGPTAPPMQEPDRGGYNPMGFDGPTMPSYQEEVGVPGLEGAATDPNIYNVNPNNMPDPMDINAVQQAADTGQKEIFDTAMISSMLRAVRDDTMIDRYIPDLVKGMDRLGRILFMFYWHSDQFADRFGKQDLPELEDSLRNAFEMVGDVVLFLKQKTIEPYPEESARDIDLGDSADI